MSVEKKVEKNASAEPGMLLEGLILVIDDEFPNRVYLRKLLQKRGCTVLLASNGEEALQLAQERLPDVILVDVVMVGMDGFEVCRRLKANKSTASIPAIMVTAKTSIDDLEKGFEYGASDYIRKPFNPRELLARVKTALALKNAQDKLLQWQRQMSNQLKLAGVLQQSLLDVSPLFTEEMIVRKANRPCETVGGDIFDVIAVSGGRFCLYMADVCGHGVGPAMVTSLLKAVIMELLNTYSSESPALICNALNMRFRQYILDPGIYATFFIGIYDPATQYWRCFNCGHPPPLLLREDGSCETQLFMEKGGMPIGLDLNVDTPYAEDEEVAMQMAAGDALFVYTDGLIEALHEDTGQECELEGLIETVQRVFADERQDNWSSLVMDALTEEGYQLGTDDCSAVTVKMVPPEALILQTFVPLKSEAVATLGMQVEQLMTERGWPDEAAFALQLIILEHGMNIIDHGHVQGAMPISVRLWLYGERCRIYFEDYGRRWDAKERFRRASLPTDKEEHGRGLMILKTVADSMDFYRRDSRNIASYVVSRDYSTEDAMENS